MKVSKAVRKSRVQFGHVKPGMPVKHLSGDVKWETCLESREKIWAGHINWRVINISMESQVWGTYVEGGRKRFPDAWGTIAFRGFSEKQRTAMRLGQSQEGESTQTLRKGNGLWRPREKEQRRPLNLATWRCSATLASVFQYSDEPKRFCEGGNTGNRYG